MMLLEPQSLRACSGCRHWNIDVRVADEGALKGVCEQPAAAADHDWHRGSDRCGQWERRQ